MDLHTFSVVKDLVHSSTSQYRLRKQNFYRFVVIIEFHISICHCKRFTWNTDRKNNPLMHFTGRSFLLGSSWGQNCAVITLDVINPFYSFESLCFIVLFGFMWCLFHGLRQEGRYVWFYLVSFSWTEAGKKICTISVKQLHYNKQL